MAVRLLKANQAFFTISELVAWLESEGRRNASTAESGILDQLHAWASKLEAEWADPALFTIKFISQHAAHVTFRHGLDGPRRKYETIVYAR